MYTFLEKLTLLLMPRLREFERVLLRSYDKKGNYTIGVEGLMGFPELQLYFESFEQIRGLDITFVVNRSKGQLSQRDGGGEDLSLEDIQNLPPSQERILEEEGEEGWYSSIDGGVDILTEGVEDQDLSQTFTLHEKGREVWISLEETRKRNDQEKFPMEQVDNFVEKKRVNHSALLLSAFQLPF
jgi:hypothetical protein